MERLSVEGLDALLQEAEKHQSNTAGVYILCCGSVQPETGESWCSDCVKGKLWSVTEAQSLTLLLTPCSWAGYRKGGKRASKWCVHSLQCRGENGV